MKLTLKERLFNAIYRLLRKLGVRETRELLFKDFIDAIQKLALEKNEDYISVSVEYTTHKGITLTGYYNGNTRHTGKTIQEVVNKFKNYKEPDIIENVIII